MMNRVERLLALAETLRHWDESHACDFNAAHYFAHRVLMRALREDPELMQVAYDPEALQRLVDDVLCPLPQAQQAA